MSPQKTSSYRSPSTNPNVPTPTRPRSAIEDLDDFFNEVDDLLTQEETFATNYRARGGE